MPLGDPCGGEFIYTDEGLPSCISAVTIKVSDMARSLNFYCDLLGFEKFDEDKGFVYLRRKAAIVILKEGEGYGVDTGLYLGVDNPFDLHRRLIDEAVVFVRDPMNSPIGVYTSFRDPDCNVLHCVDMLGKVEKV